MSSPTPRRERIPRQKRSPKFVEKAATGPSRVKGGVKNPAKRKTPTRKSKRTDKAGSVVKDAPAREIGGFERRYLRALGHQLKAVVQIGHLGLTPGVIEETARALDAHELIKIKLGRECPEDAAQLPARLEQPTRSHVVQVIGQTLLVYRERRENPSIVLPTRRKPRAPKSIPREPSV